MSAEGAARWRAGSDTVAALVCVVLGVAILLLIPHQVDEPPAFFGRSSAAMSPKVFPYVAGVGLVAVGLVYAALSLRMPQTAGFGGMEGGAWLNVAFVLVVMLAFITLLRPIGFVAASFLAALSISLYYGSRSVVGIAIVSVVAPVSIYYLFTRALRVSLPSFPWF